VQRSLLRTIEDGRYNRIGESEPRPADVHFVLAVNAPGPDFGLAHDLLARLRVISIPPLKERVADIPEIFSSALRDYLGENGFNPDIVIPLLRTDHFEAMCLDGFERSNVRGILDLVDRLVSKMVARIDPKTALGLIFQERFGQGKVAQRHAKSPGPRSKSPSDPAPDLEATSPMSSIPAVDENVSHYEVYKEHIESAYRQCNGNLTATERMLRASGIRCTRRWLGIYTKKWGLR
jgi:transcriptional regulator with AAA-type ATPase domain